jgi:tetratricopeptide (TPR) repeat protein
VKDKIAYNEAGLSALAALDYDEAIRNFESALQIDPAYAVAHFNLGVAHEELGDLAAAREAYEAALTHDRELLVARYRLAELLLDAGEVEAGFEVVDTGMRILQLGDVEIAQETHDRLMFLLLATRGRAYFERGGEANLSLAAADLQQALIWQDAAQYPAVVYYYLAQIHEANGETEDARQDWYNVLAFHDPNNARHREWAAQARAAVPD